MDDADLGADAVEQLADHLPALLWTAGQISADRTAWQRRPHVDQPPQPPSAGTA